MEGLLVSIYKTNMMIECDTTNGGASRCADKAVLVGDGVPEIFEVDGRFPVFKLVRRNIFGSEYLHVEPIERPTGVGWMAGGNFVYTSDSRFPNKYPISIHDRQESQELNDLLSM